MVSTRQITGSKDEIVEQIRGVYGHILSAILVVEDRTPAPAPITDEELTRLFAEMAQETVGVPHADDSREAIYTRMPGE